MMAVWGLTGLDKPMIPLYEPLYDTRVIAKSLELAGRSDTLSLETLGKLKDAVSASFAHLLGAALGRLPEPAI